MQLKVFKYEAAGNDFVALDDRRQTLPPEPEALCALVRALCDRRRGIGADGMLVLRDPVTPDADFRMAYFNRDGSLGEMCGNGARSIARFARLMGAAGDSMDFETDAGLYSARLEPGGVRLAFPDIPGTPDPRDVALAERTFRGSFQIIGVPHYVAWVDDLETLDVARWGRALRHHDAFAPAGTNVNFAQPLSDNSGVRIRTYERGVEEETLACGTGSVASALAWARQSANTSPVRAIVIPTSGDTLEVRAKITPDGATGVTLEGPARLVFTTVVEWDVVAHKLVVFDFSLGRRAATP